MRVREKQLRRAIGKRELKNLLLRWGGTLRNVAEAFDVSHQLVKIRAGECGIDIVRDRQPEWFAIRAGVPQLASRALFVGLLARCGSVKELRTYLGFPKNGRRVSLTWLHDHAVRLGVSLGG